MRALVTGAAGFVGSHLVTALEAGGHDVYSTDLKIEDMDLADITNVRAVFAWGPDIVFHLAGSCSTSGSIARPLETFHDTVQTAVNVLDCARIENVPVVLTSSVKARDGETPYGAAKVMVETWAREYRRMYRLPVIINRPGTIYGPGQEGSDESGWIAWFCKAKAEGLTVTINGDGEQVRDLLHVSDYVRLMMLEAANVELYDGGVFDVGGGAGNSVTVNQIVRHLELDHIYGPPRPGDSRLYVGVNDVPFWEPRVCWWESETLA